MKGIFLFLISAGSLIAQNYNYYHPYDYGYYTNDVFTGQGSYYQNSPYYYYPEGGGYPYLGRQPYYHGGTEYQLAHPRLRYDANIEDYHKKIQEIENPQAKHQYYRDWGRRRYIKPEIHGPRIQPPKPGKR